MATSVIGPNLGLYYGLDPLMVPSRAVQEGQNFRILNGQIGNVNLGWKAAEGIDFKAPLLYFGVFQRRDGTSSVLALTTRDVFNVNLATQTATLLNVRFNTGTVNVSGTAVSINTGTPNWQTNGIRDGDMISFGDAAENDPEATWYTISAATDTTITLSAAGPTVTNSVYTIRRRFAGDLLFPWKVQTFVLPDDGVGDDLWFATNGVDPIITWDGAASTVTMQSALGFTAKSMAVFKNQMIYGGIVDIASGDPRPLSIINSDIGKPLAAGSLGTGLSSEFRVHDSIYPIRELLPLGDNLCIYTERQVVLAQFVGDPFIFVFREAGKSVGPLSNRAVADFGDYHEFIGQDTQYLFDGVSSTPINEHVWREVLRQRDASRQDMIFHTFDEERGEVIWSIPLTSDAGVGDETQSAEEAFVEHYLEEVGQQTPTPFSRRAFPFTCTGDSTVASGLTWDGIAETWEEFTARWNSSNLFAAFPLQYGGTTAGGLHELNTVQTGAGASLPSYVLTGRRPLGDGMTRNLLTRVMPFATKLDATLTVTARMMDHASGPATIEDAKTFDTTLNEGAFFTSHFRAGRYFELQFGTTGGAWQLSGFDVAVRQGGMR